MGSTSEPPAGIAFGRFRLLPHRRELLADGQPIRLGGRAYDVLLALIEAPGAVVSKDALMVRVWGDRVVEENALQVQISALRAALRAEPGLIRTVSGRGYQFTGDIRLLAPAVTERPIGDVAEAGTGPVLPAGNLPEPVSELIGRNDEISECLSLVNEHRLVTLTGAGGIGKTRLAIATAHRLLPEFVDGVWFAEFSPLADPALVPAAVATALGLELAAGEITSRRVAQTLAGRHILLVLDTCEHVVDAAAQMAELLLQANLRLRLIATSREPLKAEGEWVYPVPPLAVPGEDVRDDGSPLQYGGVRLFLDRARAVEPRFAPGPRQAAMMAAICRRLDGIPLAIELAAARAATLGIEELAARIDDRFNLLAGGRRTALPRHQALRATLDWSHDLLSEPERVVLRRLAVFASVFNLEAVTSVASGPDVGPSDVVGGLANLVTKSLVTVEVDRTIARYRLLDTTRVYALEKLQASRELGMVARRHAEYCGRILERAEAEWGARPTSEWMADYGRLIDDLRAALDWAFSPIGDVRIGIALTANSERLWFSQSLMDECRRRVQVALSSLEQSGSGTPVQQMRLCATLAVALFNTKGPGPEASASWGDVLRIAEQVHDSQYSLHALWGLWYNHISNGDCRAALSLAHRYNAALPSQADPTDLLVGERMLGTSLYYLGDLADARHHLGRVLEPSEPSARRSHIVRFQFDLPVAARGTLLRVLWLQGFADQAIRMAKDNVEDALAIDNVVSLYWALDAACMIALATGDHAMAEHSTGLLLEYSAKNALAFWQALGDSYEGQLLIGRGDAAGGVRRLRTGVDELRETKYVLRSPGLLGALAEGLASAGQVTQAQATINEALAQCEATDELWSMAELLRIKGELHLLEGAAAMAEDYLRRSLDWARRQGALAWELRAATSLARFFRELGRRADALALLQPAHDRFTEGLDTADLKTARALLAALR